MRHQQQMLVDEHMGMHDWLYKIHGSEQGELLEFTVPADVLTWSIWYQQEPAVCFGSVGSTFCFANYPNISRIEYLHNNIFALCRQVIELLEKAE